jgi:hypothetical protein
VSSVTSSDTQEIVVGAINIVAAGVAFKAFSIWVLTTDPISVELPPMPPIIVDITDNSALTTDPTTGTKATPAATMLIAPTVGKNADSPIDKLKNYLESDDGQSNLEKVESSLKPSFPIGSHLKK